MMVSIRSVLGAMCAALMVTACGSPPAQAQTWQVIDQPGGYKVARVSMTGGGSRLVQGIGLTCERAVPMIALNLARAPARNPALLSLSDGKATGKLGVVRNGTSNVWAGPVRDARVLDMLARAGSVEVAVDGVKYGTVSLAGAADAMRGALSRCWAGAVVAATGGTSTALAPDAAVTAAAVRDADEEFIRRDIARIFGYRDGRQLADRYYNPDPPRITLRLQALFDACNLAVEKAPPGNGNDEGTYGLTGDQGCREGDLSALDGIGNYTDDEVPFIRAWIPTFKRVSSDIIEAELEIPRTYWAQDFAESVVYRYRKVSGAWLIDDVGHRYKGKLGWLSESIKELTVEIQNYSKKKRGQK